MNVLGNVRIPVDDDYVIIVDDYNWQVTRIKTWGGESKHEGEKYETPVAFCHDLTKAIYMIVKYKANEHGDFKSIEAYLSWQESTIHSLADRVLRQRKVLSEALELNGVM